MKMLKQIANIRITKISLWIFDVGGCGCSKCLLRPDKDKAMSQQFLLIDKTWPNLLSAKKDISWSKRVQLQTMMRPKEILKLLKIIFLNLILK